jgi:hypothetical protein
MNLFKTIICSLSALNIGIHQITRLAYWVCTTISQTYQKIPETSFDNSTVLTFSYNKLSGKRFDNLLALALGFNDDFFLKSETPEDEDGDDGTGVELEELKEAIEASVIWCEDVAPLEDAVSTWRSVCVFVSLPTFSVGWISSPGTAR